MFVNIFKLEINSQEHFGNYSSEKHSHRQEAEERRKILQIFF